MVRPWRHLDEGAERGLLGTNHPFGGSPGAGVIPGRSTELLKVEIAECCMLNVRRPPEVS